MVFPNFGLALAFGAVLLACWLDVRLERKRPESATTRIGHALAAYAVVRVTAIVTHGIVDSDGPAPTLLAVVFVLVLPGLVYAFLAGLWLMRTLAEVARLSRR